MIYCTGRNTFWRIYCMTNLTTKYEILCAIFLKIPQNTTGFFNKTKHLKIVLLSFYVLSHISRKCEKEYFAFHSCVSSIFTESIKCFYELPCSCREKRHILQRAIFQADLNRLSCDIYFTSVSQQNVNILSCTRKTILQKVQFWFLKGNNKITK